MGDLNGTETKKRDHLVVLVHGLWGSSQNLARVESVIHKSLGDSTVCNIHTFAPDCFSHFKTYDGVVAIGDYIIPDLFNHLKNLKNNYNVEIDDISFIGYSLGGLIARYVIGELYNIGFFNTYKPVFYTSFATPHLGSTFYNSNTWILNFLGSRFLGQTGKDLFMVEKNNGILYKLSDPNNHYMKGLNCFKSKLCIANVKFDRTVGFYSAFITKYDVFNDWKNVLPAYIPDLPTAILKENDQLIEAFVIDFNKSLRLDTNSVKDSDKSKMDHYHETNKFTLFFILSVVALIFPIIFGLSTFATIKSFFRINILSKPNIKKLWTSTKEYLNKKIQLPESAVETQGLLDSKDTNIDTSIEDKVIPHKNISISHVTREVVENSLNLINNDADMDLELERTISKKSFDESSRTYSIDVDFELDYKSRSFVVDNITKHLTNDSLSNSPLTDNLKPLSFSETRDQILQNLNTIEWTKIAVLLHSLNAHQSVVGRRGFKRTPEGIPFLFLYTFLLEDIIKKSNEN